MKRTALLASLTVVAAWSPAVVHAEALGTGFTYQGRLDQNGTPVGGTVWQMVFELYDAEVDGNPSGQPVAVDEVSMVDGLFTVTLDFGAEAFNGDNLWLDIQVERNEGDGLTPLSPRQPVTAAPYALQTRGIFVNESGQVGIGTTDPFHDLHVVDQESQATILLDSVNPSSPASLILRSGSGNRFWSIFSRGVTHALEIADGFGNIVMHFSPDSANVGIGTTTPLVRLHIEGGTDVSPTGGGFLQTGEQSGLNIGIDSNEIMARSGGEVSTLYLNNDGGDVIFNGRSGPGNVGIGTTAPTTKLHVKGTGTFRGNHVAYFESVGESADGIAIQLGNAHTNAGNNFLTFYNSNGQVTGRIEGFDLENGDWVSLPPIPDVSFDVDFDTGSLPTANFNPGSLPSVRWCNDFGIRYPCEFNTGSLPSLGFDGGRLPWVNGFSFDLPTEQEIEDLVCWGLANGVGSFMQTDPVAIAIEALKVAATKKCLDEGVVYGSKGADYAEWLPKLNPDEDIRFAQIVGVRGGKVTLDTRGAEQIMATSRAPVVVGNIPSDGETENYVKVGFMGQIPVVVRGHVEPGDYIVPSGYEDGTGIAVSPADIRVEHLDRILGRAWSASENDIFGLIDVVIGVSTNEAKEIFTRHEERMDELAAENATLQATLDELIADVSELKAALVSGPHEVSPVGRRR